MEIPRRAVVRLVRFGFEDGERAARLLSDPALGPVGPRRATSRPTPRPGRWSPRWPGPVTPTSPLRSLHRLVEALDGTDATGGAAAALLARLRGSALLRTRLLAVLGASSGLADHLAAHPARLGGARRRRRRAPSGPTRAGARAADARRRRRRPARPAVGGAARQGRARRRRRSGSRALRVAYRRAILSLAGRDLGEGLRGRGRRRRARRHRRRGAHRRARRWPSPSSRPTPPACRLAVIGLGKCGGRELNYVSDVDVVFVAEPVDPSDPEGAGAGQRDPGRGRAHADLPRGRVGGRRRAAARGQGRRAGAHRRRAPGLLRAVGEHLGVPGAAEDARRWPATPTWAAGLRRRALADGVEGRRPAGLRRRGAGDAPPGRGQHPARAGRARAQAGPRRPARRRVRRPAAAAGARPGRSVAARSAAPCPRSWRCRPAVTSAARTPRR